MTYSEKLAEIQRRRQELFALEQSANREAKSMQPLTADQEREMHVTQARFDEAYTKAGRRAEPPHAYERPDSYRQRLIAGLQKYSPKYQGKDLTGIAYEPALASIEKEICDDAARFGPIYGMKDGEIKAVETSSGGGHKVINFIGTEGTHFTQQFSRPVGKAILPTFEEANRMLTNNLLAKVTQRVPGYLRELVTSPKPNF
jgi:hypothetical protein